MIRLHLPLLALALAALVPVTGLAQDGGGVIQLPAFGASPELPQEAPATIDPPAPAGPAPIVVEPEVTLVPPASDVEAPAFVPVARDGTAEAEAEAGGWLVSPRPVETLPTGVQIGASLPEPGILRLTGEVAHVTLRMDLPQGVTPTAPLQLALRSSVNVLPDLARLTVRVNGAEPVELPLIHLGDFATVEIPSAALTPGRNLLSLSLVQPHRIFCGPEATFEVWSEIALGQSGLRVDAATLALDAQGFALAALSQTAGGRRLPLLADEADDPKVMRAVTNLLSAAMGQTARVDVQSFYGLGTPPLASVALIASDAPAVQFRRGAAGGIVMQIEHKAGELPDLSPVLAGFDAAAALSLAVPVTPGQPTALSDLAGLDGGDIIGNTHYFRSDIPFALPGDWLLMANQKARLDLHYGFAKGLPEGSILLVKVNGETVRLLPLDKEGGTVLPPLPIAFNANLLHPDRNELSFEMMVPGNPPGEVCPIRRTDFLAILGDSHLNIPPSPSMVLPGLTTVLLRLDPAQVVAAVDAGDERSLAMIAQEIASELDASQIPDPEARLQVATLGELAMVPLETAGLSMTQVQNLLFPKAPTLPEAPAVAAPARPAFSLDDEPATDGAAAEAEPGVVSALWQSIAPRAWFAQEMARIRDSAFTGSSLSLSAWLAGRTGTALLLRPDQAEPGQLWLVLGATADPRDVGAALNLLREDGLAQGEAAFLDSQGEWQVWSPTRPPVLLEQPELGEVRTVIGNFASWSPLLFTLALLVLALLSAVPALLYVLLSRREGGAA